MNRQRLLLAILAVVLVLSLVYAFWAMPRQEQAAGRAPAPAAKPVVREGKAEPKPGKAGSQKALTKQKVDSERLHLELLQGDNQPLPDSGRDIFRFNAKWTPVPENVVPEVVEAPPPPPPPPPPTPEELLSKELASYKVTGLLEKRGVRSLFLTDGKDIFVIKAGERFGPRNKFIVSAITETELVVAEEKSRSVTVALPMGGINSAEPAIMSPVSVARPEAPPEPPAQETPTEPPGRRLRARPAAGVAPGGSPPEGAHPAAPEVQMEPPSGE